MHVLNQHAKSHSRLTSLLSGLSRPPPQRAALVAINSRLPPVFRTANGRCSGAEVFRQRQAAKNIHSHGGQGSPNNRSKGLVITRYGPPPSQYPPPAPQNAWGPPGGPYPPPAQPPNTYAQPPPVPYPPSSQSLPPYPPPYQNVIPPPGVYGPPVPPPPAPGPGYGQYGQPSYPPPAPPQSYAPPGPYGPPSYAPPYQPPNPGYDSAPPPSFPGPPPPPAPPPVSYPPGYGNAASPGPPPPGLPPGMPPNLPPPPPISYPPTPYSSGYEPQAAYPAPYPPPQSQSWQQGSSGQNHSRHRDHRDRRNDRDKGGRNKQSGRGNDRHHRGRDRRHQGPCTRSSSHSRQRTPRLESEKKDDSVRSTPRVEDVKVDVKDPEVDDEFSWDLEKAFIELDKKPGDPVGKPLAADWSDEPTIPPAYNAKCVKSAFCDPENPESFTLSVRESKQWFHVKRDPIFRHRRDMVVVRFPGSSHEYFTYHFSRKLEGGSLNDREVVAQGPSDPSLSDVVRPAGTPSKDGQFVSDSHSGKRGHDNLEGSARGAKRLKVQPERMVHTLPPRPMSPRPRSRSPAPGLNINVRVEPWSPQPDETVRPDSRGRYSRSPSGHQKGDPNSGGHFTPRDSRQRYDSGYQSAHSGDRSKPYRERSHSRRLSPPPSRRGRGPSSDRSRDDPTPRKWSPSYAKARGRTRSPTPIAAASDAESADLSDLEYELLGMERPEKKKKKKAVPSKSAVKRRQVKMNDAFGRRW